MKRIRWIVLLKTLVNKKLLEGVFPIVLVDYILLIAEYFCIANWYCIVTLSVFVYVTVWVVQNQLR